MVAVCNQVDVETYVDLGIEETEAHRWQRIATIPDVSVVAWVPCFVV